MNMKESSSRWLAGVVLAVLVLIVLSVAVTLLNQREADLLPEDTPEGVVQSYLMAIDEGDSQTAYSYLSSELQETCTQQNLRDSARWLEEGDLSATMEETKTLDGQAEVRVHITQIHVSSPSFPPFGPQESSNTAWYILEREGESWRFTEPPWPLGWCPGLERKAEPLATPVPAM